MRNYLLVLSALFLLTGCPAEPPKGDDVVQNTDQQNNASATTSKLGDNKKAEGQAFNAGEEPYRKDAIYDANSPLSQQIIYFDFDASTVKDEYRDLITWHGRYLASNPDMKVRLEGHTDERGSPEYNVALGERRATAVSRMLKFQGATSDQISIVSFGEEKPVAYEHNESAWSQNRRVQLVYEAK